MGMNNDHFFEWVYCHLTPNSTCLITLTEKGAISIENNNNMLINKALKIIYHCC